MLAVPAAGFESFVEGIAESHMTGLNVTLPHKEAALALSDTASEAARRIGAANLLTFADGIIHADNTDAAGFLAALKPAKIKYRQSTALVLGAGGASRALVHALLTSGISRLILSNRSKSRAERLVDEIAPMAAVVDWDQKDNVLAEADLVINATSLGLKGVDPLQLDWKRAKPGSVAFDSVYTPLETEFLKGARQRGLTGVDGLDMLIGQARPSFRAFFGREAPILPPVRPALVAQLGDGGAALMFHLGLTGSIGMGKSATAKLFREQGGPVFDSDAIVHELYDVGGAAVKPVGAAFPGVVHEGAVDREILSARLREDPSGFETLEAIVHPLVGRARQHFLTQAEKAGAPFVILDVPLLFETGGHEHVDAVVVVHAPQDERRARVLQRPGMTDEKLDAIIARQTPDSVKLDQADYIVETSGGFDDARRQVSAIVKKLAG